MSGIVFSAGIRNNGVRGAGANRVASVTFSNIFMDVNEGPTASFLGKVVALSGGKCVVTSRAAGAGVSNIFTINSIQAGTLERIMATMSSNTATMRFTRRCLSRGWFGILAALGGFDVVCFNILRQV